MPNRKERNLSKIIEWINVILLLLLVILFLYVSTTKRTVTTDIYQGVIEEDQHLVLVVPYQKVATIKEEGVLFCQQDRYWYKIANVSEETISNNQTWYKTIEITSPGLTATKALYTPLEIAFQIKKETFWENLQKIWKGE